MIDDIYYCETCQHCEIEPHLEPCVSCKTTYLGTPTKYLAKRRTNADRIRAMSDEELADIMSMHTATGACNDWGIPHKKCGGNCCECIIEWLKQPAETPTNADRCVCCGEIIPEGRQVCPNCLAAVKKGKDYGRENIE